jgi:hypothetical protein
MYQDNDISDDDEDIIDKRRKYANCWLFIDEELLIHDTCVGEDAVRELREEAEMKRLIQIDAKKKRKFVSLIRTKCCSTQLQLLQLFSTKKQKICQATLWVKSKLLE